MKFKKSITVSQPVVLIDLLAETTNLSKTVLKDCLIKGCIWLKKAHRKKEIRVRKAKGTLKSGDRITVYYDDAILSQPVPLAECIFHCNDYSVWNKPAGLLSQGTRYGDHCSLLRHVEKELLPKKQTPYLVHRLDREAYGLVIIAHHSKAAAKLSALFTTGKVTKKYRATVAGILKSDEKVFTIETPLDGKNAITEVTILQKDQEDNRSIIDVDLKTGRYHQIRKHLSSIGHSLIGDFRYGKKKQGEELQLCAYKLSFNCPFTKELKQFEIMP